MKLQRAIAACLVVSVLLLAGVIVEYLSVPRNAISAAAVLRRSWPSPGEQSSNLVSALVDADKVFAAAQAGSSCLEIRHQLQLQQHAFCL